MSVVFWSEKRYQHVDKGFCMELEGTTKNEIAASPKLTLFLEDFENLSFSD